MPRVLTPSAWHCSLSGTATLSRQFYCCNLKEEIDNHGVVSPVSALGVRHWQRWGSKHSVNVAAVSSTLTDAAGNDGYGQCK